MDTNVQICLVVGGLILLGFVLWFCMKEKKKIEAYSNISDLDNVGSLDATYELVKSADEAVPVEHFADLVDAGDQLNLLKTPKYSDTDNAIRPIDRLERIHNTNLLPRVSASTTPYNIEIANPSTWAFSVNAPRVQLKNRLYDAADVYRGDIAIRYMPNVPLISASSYGRDSQRLDGFFSDASRSIFSKYSGRAFRNMPIKTSVGGTVMDFSDV